MAYYIGVMSGTSQDGLDIVLADLNTQSCRLISAETIPFTQSLKQQLYDKVTQPNGHFGDYAKLDVAFGRFIAASINQFLTQQHVSPEQITAIGSHGHTLFHQPEAPQPYSLQVGNGNVIAHHTGITTITDFRQRDIAAGGQGAPLVPAFHHAVFSSKSPDCAIINIGGIANITVITPSRLIGFDTGPGNTLLDIWVQHHQHKAFDEAGRWAKAGQCQPRLLTHYLTDPYFHQPIPKSTGREYFNLAWIEQGLSEFDTQYSAVDVQATLLQLTAITIARAIKQYAINTKAIYLCGGGVHNTTLCKAISTELPEYNISMTAELGIDPDWVEGLAFAWLAYRHIEGLPGNIPSVTGATSSEVLGALYPA